MRGCGVLGGAGGGGGKGFGVYFGLVYSFQISLDDVSVATCPY